MDVRYQTGSRTTGRGEFWNEFKKIIELMGRE